MKKSHPKNRAPDRRDSVSISNGFLASGLYC
jgi:hypothetical protein